MVKLKVVKSVNVENVTLNKIRFIGIHPKFLVSCESYVSKDKQNK